MKKITLLASIFLLFLSCSNDESEQTEEQLIACFDVSNDTLEVGEEFQITNCSVGASSFEFDFGNGTTSTDNAPSVSYQESGVYTVKLKVTSSSGAIKITTQIVRVNDIEENYLYVPVLEGDNLFPINFGFSDNSFYYIENFWNIFAASSGKFNYVKIDFSDNTFNKSYIANKSYNSGHAFVSTLSNDEKLFYSTRSLQSILGLKEVKLNSSLQPQSTQNNTYRVLYGVLEDNDNYLYYGAYRISSSNDTDFSLYKSPSIDIRDDMGIILERKTYNEIEQGFIGDLEKTDDGFMAFGGITDPIDFNTFENYRPLIIFLDNDYEYVSHVTYENTSIAATNNNNLNASFNIAKIATNNYALYSHNEFRLIDAQGNELIKSDLPTQSSVQSLLALENEGFIISSKDYLRKYDLNANLIKSIKFNGKATPNLVLNDNKIFFASGYSSSYIIDENNYSVLKTFIGAMDKDLNIINLN
ncbi:PKD domain-containing protein [Dokdonia sp. R86516]|uniref:PKD domain-containing protein n=1 Tax=Dokdonia sp. R86516 TaxID=3093856 RepID=UPI0037C966C3